MEIPLLEALTWVLVSYIEQKIANCVVNVDRSLSATSASYQHKMLMTGETGYRVYGDSLYYLLKVSVYLKLF